MENSRAVPMHRKRRRRRRLNRPPISAHLVLDERMKQDVGILSEDLFKDLFPEAKGSPEDNVNRIFHIAITPWMPLSAMSADTTQWTILPVRPLSIHDTLSQRWHSSLQFSPNSLALQSFANILRNFFPNKTLQKKDAPLEIRISEVVPLGLDTIYVRLDTDALRKLEDVHTKFGGGFGVKSPAKSKAVENKDGDQKVVTEKKWRDAVRGSLNAPRIVHTGDLLPLPLPAHPITHVPPPPAKITSCEPVSQGIVIPSTRIVILHGKSKDAEVLTKPIGHRRGPSLTNGIPEEDEDTSNEQFFSAAEEIRTQSSSPPDESTLSDTEASGTDADNLSDDPEDVISLSAPTLPSHTSGVMSHASATPRPGQPFTNEMATPGSVFSTFSSSTVRGGSGVRSKTFKAYGLLDHISDDLLHPKPGTDDDDEARVFVDTAALGKLGCFSGDWVRIEATMESSREGFGHWHLSSFGHGDEEQQEWRVAKIYGLPEFMSRKENRYVVHKTDERPVSFLGGNMLPPTSVVHLSPLLLANLESPTHLKISALTNLKQEGPMPPSGSKSKVSPHMLPPLAKEVTLLKVATPLSSDRLVQPSLFAGLKDFFEKKRRVVKKGDFVGIAVDESLGKAVFEGGNPDDPNDEMLSKLRGTGEGQDAPANGITATGVGWFKVSDVASSVKVETEEEDLWGGVTHIDASNTKMVQAGGERSKFPPTTTSTWPYYLGLRKVAASSTRGPGAGIISTDLPQPYVSNLRRRLRELISAATSPRAMHLGLPPVAILLTSTQRNIGKAATATHACEDLGLHTFPIDAFDILTEGGDTKIEAFLKARAERALSCGKEFTALLIRHIEKLEADRMVAALKEILADSRVLIATTTEVEKVPEGIRSLFTHELEMNAPDEGEREGILRGVVEDAGVRLAPDVSLSSVAVKTAALVAGDLVDVVDRAMVARQNRLDMLTATANKALLSGKTNGEVDQPVPEVTPKDLTIAGHPTTLTLTSADLTAAVDAARKNFADAIGAPKIPNVQWSDVGGLSHVKSAVIETIQLPLARPELFAKGMKKRSGILFYGPPGTGKTLLAKAIATEFSLNFFSVKGPELLNMYIGESEANVRRVFQRARDARPCVVFFDELDSVAPKRGNQGDSGGVMDRIVSQLLAELDGMSGGSEDGAAGGGQGVFVIGATNRPDLLDQALLRPGRFDKMLYLGVNDTHEGQLKVLEALTRKFALHPSLSVPRVSQTLPFTYTGADLYALCSDAMLKAITRQARNVDVKVAEHNKSLPAGSDPISIAYFFDHFAGDEDTEVVVVEDDFEAAKRELVPSVSKDELWHYERVRRAFEGATIGAKDAAKTKEESVGQNKKESVESGDVPSKKLANADTHHTPTPPPPTTLHVPKTTQQQPVEPRGSWMKQAKDRIKRRSTSRGRGGGVGHGGGHGGGIAQAAGKGKGRTEFGQRSQASSDSPESVYRMPSAGSVGTDGAVEDRKEEKEDDDDEYVIKTEHLKSNGSAVGSGKGKGKGKWKAQGAFGDAAGEDDEMYA